MITPEYIVDFKLRGENNEYDGTQMSIYDITKQRPVKRGKLDKMMARPSYKYLHQNQEMEELEFKPLTKDYKERGHGGSWLGDQW